MTQEPTTVNQPGVKKLPVNNKSAQSKKMGTLPTIIILALVFIFTMCTRFFILQVAVVEGASMEDTLQEGERVLVLMCDYWSEKPARGDVVMCSYPGREGNYIKRILALPGEMVMIRGGTVYVDGRSLTEKYILYSKDDENFGPVIVPDGSYFVMGDNRTVSGDSRLASIGSIHISQIHGRAVATITPFSKTALIRRR